MRWTAWNPPGSERTSPRGSTDGSVSTRLPAARRPAPTESALAPWHTTGNAEQAADVEVLAGLRFDGLVGRDDKQDQVDAADAGQHIFHEPLMAGHINETQAQGRRQLQVSEAEIDGDAATFLFSQAVGVNAG